MAWIYQGEGITELPALCCSPSLPSPLSSFYLDYVVCSSYYSRPPPETKRPSNGERVLKLGFSDEGPSILGWFSWEVTSRLRGLGNPDQSFQTHFGASVGVGEGPREQDWI